MDNAKKTASSPQTTYSSEKRTVLYLIDLLENRLAGRHKDRIIRRMPIDECQLGVLLPWRKELNEVDPLETGEIADDVPTSQTTSAESRSGKEDGPAEQDKREAGIEEERPFSEASSEQDYVRRPPSSIGAEFLLESNNGGAEIEVDVMFAVYTPHLPTYLEQKSSLGGVADSAVTKGDMTLADVWQRREVSVNGIRFSFPGERTDDGVVQREIDKVISNALACSDAMPEFEGIPKLGEDVLSDEAKFRAWASEARRNRSLRRMPLRGIVEARSFSAGPGRLRVSIYLRNDTIRGASRTDDNYRILADAQVKVRILTGSLLPVEILPIPEDYQYDRKIWAVGHNASIEVASDRREMKTRTLARIQQPRFVTQNDPPARFAELDSDPFGVLERIRLAMESYAERWKTEVLEKDALGLEGAFLEECRKDYENFKAEINRFSRGIAAMKADPRLFQAFRGMNRVMGRLARGYDSWRLFQIVFIVTQLPAMAIRERRIEGEYPNGFRHYWGDELDWADVLWFPTGGGKTEAYFGMISCAILYDRLRGKAFGLTAWLRFPLRMLSIQQLQRAIRMIWETEKERVAMLGKDADKSDPVRLGYFIGGTTTPNKLDDSFFQKCPDESACEKFRVVTDCPACGAEDSVQTVPDKAKFRLRHVCKSCKAELPLFVSDSEVYRYLPALIVGTVDKMATVGFQSRFGILWAGPRWKCSEHGYSFGDFCEVKGCEAIKGKRAKSTVSVYDPAPTFHVQDELHLLQEELGAFAGHYETLTRSCEEHASYLPAKVIAATATIEGYEHQVRHLYGVKRGRRFPGRGYKPFESFYTTLEPDPESPGDVKTARYFVAFRPPAGATADMAGRCALVLHEEISKWIRRPETGLAALPFISSREELANIIHFYSTTLTYVNSLTSGTRIKDLLGRESHEILKGLRDLNIEYLSSRSSSGEVSSVIHRMEQPPLWEDRDYLDAVVATNMISHGVDLERINLMIMDKFPAETAEYIQASSRSGRKKAGLIIVVLPAYDLRAASIYNRFREYHQHLDRLVSPVPVNRFAKFAVQRTLPGILAGLLFGRIGPENNDLSYNRLRKALEWINADLTRAREMLRRAYALGLGIYEHDLEDYYSRLVDDKFEELRMRLRASQEDYLTSALHPMTSLRDVERAVPFRPQSDDIFYLQSFRKDTE